MSFIHIVDIFASKSFRSIYAINGLQQNKTNRQNSSTILSQISKDFFNEISNTIWLKMRDCTITTYRGPHVFIPSIMQFSMVRTFSLVRRCMDASPDQLMHPGGGGGQEAGNDFTILRRCIHASPDQLVLPGGGRKQGTTCTIVRRCKDASPDKFCEV